VGVAATTSQVQLAAGVGATVVVTAPGGTAGNALATGTTNVFVAANNTVAAGGQGTVRFGGNAGGAGQRLSGTVAVSGQGAHGPWGGGGAAIIAHGNGNPGGNYGAGGSGAMSVNAGGAVTGGAGAQGVVVVNEFY
jgi:hypothetical protein